MHGDIWKLCLYTFLEFGRLITFFIFALHLLCGACTYPHLISMVGLSFVLPFFLSSLQSGIASDHFSKSHLLLFLEAAQIVTCVIGLLLLFVSPVLSFFFCLILFSLLSPLFLITIDGYTVETYPKTSLFSLRLIYFIAFVIAVLSFQYFSPIELSVRSPVILYSSLLFLALATFPLAVFLPSGMPMSFKKGWLILPLHEPIIALLEFKRVPKLRPLFLLEVSCFYLMGQLIFVSLQDISHLLLDFFLLGSFIGIGFYYLMYRNMPIKWTPLLMMMASAAALFFSFPEITFTLRSFFTLIVAVTLTPAYLTVHELFKKKSPGEYRGRNLSTLYFYGSVAFFIPLIFLHNASPSSIFFYTLFSFLVLISLYIALFFALRPHKLATL